MQASVNGIQIHYAIEGEGPWLTLSHSLACNLHMWDPQMSELTRHYRVLRFDTRGHGRSSAPAGAYTLEQMADDVKGLLAALGIEQTHWAGLSMGGMIGQVFALKYPGVFGSMTLADTTSRYPAEAAAMWGERIKIAETQGMAPLVDVTLGRWFTAGYRASAREAVEKIADSIRSTPVPGYAGCCHAIPQIDVTRRLKEIRCPTLVIVGDQDAATPVAMAREIQEALPGSELAIIPSAAHLSNVEQPRAFTDALLAFLKKADAR